MLHQLVEWWGTLVEQCIDGYEWTIYEFDDEMAVRDYIEVLINNAALQRFQEYAEFKQRVVEIDDRYRGVLQEGIGDVPLIVEPEMVSL